MILEEKATPLGTGDLNLQPAGLRWGLTVRVDDHGLVVNVAPILTRWQLQAIAADRRAA